MLLFLSFSSLYSQCDGDSNLDSNVNIQDIILVINHIWGNDILEDVALSNSDINNDQTINLLDVVIFIDIILSGNNQCELRIDLSLE